MDLITTTIMAALADLSKDAIKDGYNALKAALKKKFGDDSDLVDAINKLEKNPDSEDCKATVQEEVEIAKVNDDPDIIRLAQDLLNQAKEQPDAQYVITQTTTATTSASIEEFAADITLMNRVGVIGNSIDYQAPMTSMRGFKLVPVFFATDRKRTEDTSPKKFYSGSRGKLEFGMVKVSIPEDHKMGELEEPKSWEFWHQENPARHIVLLDIQVLEKSQFWTELRNFIETSSIEISSEPDVLIFIHGYNVSFEDAARRTAQIAYDLNFRGAPILYSWPSEAKTHKYTVDESNIQWTVPHFRDFLKQVLSDIGARNVNVIAHSMGNRALVGALRSLDINTLPKDSASLRQIVFAAPDIDADIFRQFAHEFWQNAEHLTLEKSRFTLYASSKDKALKASKKVHGYSRAGDTGAGIVIVKGVDTIDASEVDTSFMGHSYFGDNKSILADLFRLFKDGSPPNKRFCLRPREFNNLCYWLSNKV